MRQSWMKRKGKDTPIPGDFLKGRQVAIKVVAFLTAIAHNHSTSFQADPAASSIFPVGCAVMTLNGLHFHGRAAAATGRDEPRG